MVRRSGTEPKCETGIFFRIDANLQHVRMDHAAAGDLRASGLSAPPMKATSISADGSVNGKKDGRKRTFRSSSFEEALQEIGDRP